MGNLRLNEILIAALFMASLALTGFPPAGAQTDREQPPHTRPPVSQAEQEAERKVSLSAGKIIEILRNEPGLLLAVKKMLVRKAYEQGRILDPADLSDEALFRLLREDDNIRVLATREIEDRYYVRAKPTQRELEQQPILDEQRALVRTAAPKLPRAEAPTATDKPRLSQEDRYSEQHESSRKNYQPQDLRDQLQESYPSTPNPPENSVPQNPAREVQRASLQQEDDATGNLGQDQPYTANGRGTMRPQMQAPLGLPKRAIPAPSELNLDRPQIRHRPNPYANIPSLYDLYSQVSRRSPALEQFGLEVFRNGTGNFDTLPMDLPAGPDYVLGPGDGLNIELWGGVTQRLQRVVDREGRVALPEIGGVQVSGHSLQKAQRLLQAALRTQFREIEADVSLARIRSVRVYVVGDVASPGAYDVSSLSTPLNALYAAGGSTARGSLRHLRHYRGKQLIEEVDAYDLLLHGIHSELARLESGDTILVPPVGPEITVQGMIRRPAIYELGGESNLSEVLELAGGVLVSGTLRHVDVERVVAHEKRTMLRLDLPEGNDAPAANRALDDFQVQDGDTIRIVPILPYADQTVYLDGHVFHPGKYPYREGMKVGDVIHSYSDLLPEPCERHAEIIRLAPPDYTPQVLAFNLSEAMGGRDQSLVLRPFDTIRIFSRYDFEDPPVITVAGEVRDPGDHITNGVTRLRDAVYLAGGIGPDAETSDAQVFRKTSDNKLKVISVNLAKALADDGADNILLQPKDRVFIQRSQNKADPPTVTVQGQVARPGKYPLGDGMGAADLVRLAGGLNRGAYGESADLTRYLVEGGNRVLGERMRVPIAAALSGTADADTRLRDGDVLTIGELAGWNDVGATITVKGEVAHPGAYGIREGERLSSILARAGGLRADAYAYRRVQDDKNELKLVTDIEPDQKIAKGAALTQWQATIDRLQSIPPAGRLVIHISNDVRRWANSSSDIQVRAGDVIYIPKKPNFVMVDGAVYNPTAVSFRPGKSAGW